VCSERLERISKHAYYMIDSLQGGMCNESGCAEGEPGFSDAAPAETGKEMYELFVAGMRNLGVKVATGVFQAHMQVEIINDGPVTMLLDSKKLF